jgi:hypothetical protein
MSIFGKLFGWFKDFFGLVAETFIGKAAEEIKDAALEVVEELSKNPDMSGSEKWNKARNHLKEKYPSVESAAINLAIEAAVAIIKDKMDD